MEIWRSFPIKAQQWHLAKIGPYRLWMQHDKEEWRLASMVPEACPDDPGDVQTPAPCEGPPPDKELRRSIVPAVSSEVVFVPVMPDRPVVVRPESSLQVTPGAETVFFVSIPVWIRVFAGKFRASAHVLLEEPTARLTNTWFGNPETGILCYGLRSRARRLLDEISPRPHRCICPVRVRNDASAPFSFDRMCIRVEHLAIFQGETRLWANPVHCSLKGLGDTAQVEYPKSPPTYERIVGELSPMRKPVHRGILNLVFSNLWSPSDY